MDTFECQSAYALAVCFLVTLTIIIVPILAGNFLVIVSVIRFTRSRTKFDILIANLAAADLIVGLSIIPTPLDDTVLSREAYPCLLKYALFTLSLSCSVSNLCIITLERFLSVCFPLRHMVFMTKFKIYMLMSCSWITNACLAFLPIFGWNRYSENEGRFEVCYSDFIWTDTYDLIIASYIGVGVIMTTLLYIILIHSLNRRRKQRTNSVSGVRPGLLKGKTMMLIWVLGAFNVCWLPYVIVTVSIHANTDAINTKRCVRRWVIILGFINSSMNCFIYGISNEKYRHGFSDIFHTVKRKLCCCNMQAANDCNTRT